MVFEWDSDKNEQNKRKHGISFEKAVRVFADPFRKTFWDEAHSTIEEDREITIGKIDDFVIVFVVSTDRNGVTRIISARRAQAKEEAIYYGKDY